MSSQSDMLALTTEKSQEESCLDHLVSVDSRAQRVDQKFENLALEGVDFVYHVVVGSREFNAQVRSDRSLRCCAATTLFLVSVVRHGKCVEVEDESPIAAFSSTKIIKSQLQKHIFKISNSPDINVLHDSSH